MMMATPAGSGGSGSEKLAQYARKIRGEWSMEPAAALDRIVPELGGDKYKGQVGTKRRTSYYLNMRPAEAARERLQSR